jgi:hypothetical protein
MEYLLEVRWDDPVAATIARILSRVPEGLEQMTGLMPQGRGRAFVVYRSDNREVFDDLARAISNVGAQVRMTPVADTRKEPSGR